MNKKQILVLAVVAVGAFAVGMMLGKKKATATSGMLGADGDFVVDNSKKVWNANGDSSNMLDVQGSRSKIATDLNYPKTSTVDLNYPKRDLNYPKSNMLGVTGDGADGRQWPDPLTGKGWS